MIASIVVAVAVAIATPTPAPAAVPAASPAPARPAGAPLREVVYNVTTLLRFDDITESFGGGPNAVPPASTSSVENHGTVTVDVMGKNADGTLYITILGLWKQHLRLVPTKASVSPDGTVALDPSDIDELALELLPYFGTHFMPDGPLDTSTKWTLSSNGNKSSIVINYAVANVKDKTITIHKTATIKALGSESIDGTVVYLPSMLVPITGEIKKRMTEMYSDGQSQGSLNIRFDRISDTFESSPPTH